MKPGHDLLLPRIAAGDAVAVRACLDRYGGIVWSLARRFLGNSPDTEDAVQDVFVEVWKSAARYDPTLTTEATFVTMLARRRLIDRRRRSVRHPEPERLPEGLAGRSAEGLRHLELRDEAAVAIRALDELREDERRVLRLAIYQGLTHEEIARTTGLPLGTVKTHVRRGLMRVREQLGAAGPEAAGPSAAASREGGAR